VTKTLLQIRDRLQTQDRLLDQLQDGTCADCKPILEQTRDMLRTQLGQVEDGLADPQGFVNRHRNQIGVATSEPTEIPITTEEPLATENPAVIPQESCTPVLDGTGQQNGIMGTPEPQNGTMGIPEPQNDTGNGSSQQKETDNASGQQNGGDGGNSPMPDTGGQGGRP
jgi:hypothetical protein